MVELSEKIELGLKDFLKFSVIIFTHYHGIMNEVLLPVNNNGHVGRTYK